MWLINYNRLTTSNRWPIIPTIRGNSRHNGTNNRNYSWLRENLVIDQHSERKRAIFFFQWLEKIFARRDFFIIEFEDSGERNNAIISDELWFWSGIPGRHFSRISLFKKKKSPPDSAKLSVRSFHCSKLCWKYWKNLGHLLLYKNEFISYH